MTSNELNNKIILNLYNDLYNYLEQTKIKTTQIVNRVNEKFNTDIVKDIFYQPSDGLVILWEDKTNVYNSSLNIKELLSLNTFNDFINYLQEHLI